jgi:hypothetical protein
MQRMSTNEPYYLFPELIKTIQADFVALLE